MEDYLDGNVQGEGEKGPWYEFDPKTGIAAMLVLTGCLSVLFGKVLDIGELPEWFVGAFLMAVGFYLGARTVQQIADQVNKPKTREPFLGEVRLQGNRWFTWVGDAWTEVVLGEKE